MSTIVPVISSSVSGPLGIKHLPRLWLKILLHGCGRLPEGYRHGTGGFDEFLTSTLGIDRDAFVAYVETERPVYLALEDWVRTHASALSPATIAAVNERIETAELPDPMRTERLAHLNIPGSPLRRAVPLNDLDDWNGFHAAICGPA